MSGCGQPDPANLGRSDSRAIRKRQSSFGGRACYDNLLRAEPVVAPVERLDKKAGLEQRPEDHPGILVGRVVLGIGLQPSVLVVEGAHRPAMSGDVGELRGGYLAGQHIKVRRRG